jgi:hypothetical protein
MWSWVDELESLDALIGIIGVITTCLTGRSVTAIARPRLATSNAMVEVTLSYGR